MEARHMDFTLFDLSIWIYVALFATAFIAGLIDAIAGGGGLITVPVLLAAGLSPAQALATTSCKVVLALYPLLITLLRKVRWI